MSMAWIAAGTALAGLGVSYIGAKKNADAIKNAADKTAASQEAATAENFRRYGLTRGVDFNTGQAVNAKLPLWASISRGVDGKPTPVSTPANQLAAFAPGASTGRGKPIGFKNGQLIYDDSGSATAAKKPSTLERVTRHIRDPLGLFG